MRGNDKNLIAQLFVLTATESLWCASEAAVARSSISYLDIDFRAFSENDYLFYCIAYDIKNVTSHTDIEDLSNDEVVDFDLFRVVCSAIAISVYGYDAIRVSERFRKHKRRKSRKGGWKHGE